VNRTRLTLHRCCRASPEQQLRFLVDLQVGMALSGVWVSGWMRAATAFCQLGWLTQWHSSSLA